MRRSFFSKTKTGYSKILTNISVLCIAVLIGAVSIPWPALAAEQTIEVKITNQTASAVNDYQVRINFNTATYIQQGNMRQDCKDIQIKDSNQTTDLSYYYDPATCNTSITPIWVKIPTLPASPASKTIYLKFGDEADHSINNKGENVFEFFDNFDQNSIGTKWLINNAGGYASTEDLNVAYIDESNSRAIVKNGGWGALTTMTGSATPTTFNRAINYGLAAEARVKASSYSGYSAGMIYYSPTINKDYNRSSYHSFTTVTTNQATSGQKIRYGGSTSLSDLGPTVTNSPAVNNWYLHKLVMGNLNEQLVYASLSNDNDGSELTRTDLKTAMPTADLTYSNRSFAFDRYDTGTTYIDWFRVRKYLTQEPIVTIGGGGVIPNTCNQAFGEGTVAQAFCSFVVGRFNEIVGDPNTWIATDPVFVIGNGADSNNRKNAVTVLKNGNVGIGDSTPNEKLELNGNLKLTGNIVSDGDICIGKCN